MVLADRRKRIPPEIMVAVNMVGLVVVGEQITIHVPEQEHKVCLGLLVAVEVVWWLTTIRLMILLLAAVLGFQHLAAVLLVAVGEQQDRQVWRVLFWAVAAVEVAEVVEQAQRLQVL